MKYNAAVGANTPILNQVVSDVYKAIYPSLFKDTIDINKFGVSSISFDVNQAPTVDLDSSPEVKDMIKSFMTDHNNVNLLFQNLSSENISEIIEVMSTASFGVNAKISLSINYENGDAPTTAGAILKAVVSVQTSVEEDQNYLTLQAITGQVITNPANPFLDALLNKALIPFLIPYLNEKVLSPIKIPALQYQSLKVSMAVPTIQKPNFVAYSSLGIVQPDVPKPSIWPSKGVFAAVDTQLLKQAASIPFPLGPGTGFKWKIISGRVEAQVHAPKDFIVGVNGNLTATITADVLAQLTLTTPWPAPDVSFGPHAQASIAATFKPSVKNGELYILLEGSPIPSFSFDWGIPSWINWLFLPLQAGLTAALNMILGPLIGNILKLPPIKVYSLPKFSFTLAGKTIKISFEDAETTGKNSMLVVTSKIKITG
ncbi:hypothetical protein [Pedobacter antarcticus]|uniref:hypothetical protein n=1 Tax=Pedobacter antarcticus TaxID=34086 RepID=UPI00292FB587|nr:hypothetical protein [Pedobacter antarcticus]